MHRLRTPPVLTFMRWTRACFLGSAALWLLFAVLSLRMALTGGELLRWSYALLMALNAAVLAWFGVSFSTTRPHLLTLASLYAALNAVLSVTDQFGWVDALVLALSLGMLGLSFLTRQRLVESIETAAEGE